MFDFEKTFPVQDHSGIIHVIRYNYLHYYSETMQSVGCRNNQELIKKALGI